MRIASGGIQHETNTFSDVPTTLADFVRDSHCGPALAGGEILFDRYQGTGAIHGGYIAGASQAGAELIPLLCARAQPSGRVEQAAFDHMLQLFLDRLDQVAPIDGLLLDLHGAMVTQQHEDAEGVFIQKVRQRVGDQVPIVVTLDLHANITKMMATHSDVIIGFDTYPHVDMADRGLEAALLLARIIDGEFTPVQRYRQLPLVTMPPMQCTLREPMASLIKKLHAIESQPDVLTATISMGFPFADIHDAGVSILVTTNADEELADRTADELADSVWQLRDQLQPQLTPIEDAIQFALDHPDIRPILFADGSDNPGGGAPCDGTVALQALIDSPLPDCVVGILYDPETAAQAHEAGVGSSIPVQLGAKTDRLHGDPVIATAYVQSLCDGRFVYHGEMAKGVADELGLTATLVIEGVRVVVSSLRRQCFDSHMLRIAGVHPETCRLIVLKSAVHFRADFGPFAGHILDADTPGIHRPDFDSLDYRHLRKPVYPLQPVSGWQSAESESNSSSG